MARAEPSRGTRAVYAALVIGCVALALAGYAVIRGGGGARGAAGAQCVDPEARAQLDQLRRALADRDALIARLVRAPAMPGVPGAPGGSALPAGSAQPAAAPPDPGPRLYTHFEIPNPAVTVTQKPDGILDIRTTDPSLAGQVMPITAVTKSGEEDKMLIRIPQ